MADHHLAGRADVLKGASFAGELERVGSHVRWVPSPSFDRPVATSLPVGRIVQIGAAGAVPPFFAGLLPEGRRLTLLRQHLKVSADDELAQLIAVGADTVGDVRIVAAGTTPESPAPRFRSVDAPTPRFADLLPASIGAIDRVALPGVQAKVSARMATLPVRDDTVLSDAILKLETGDLPGLVRNEAACLDIAADAGLPAATGTLITDVEDRPGLLVRRFDRVVHQDVLLAVAQEDGCQVLGLWPADKYQTSTEAVVEALARQCAAPRVAALRLWEQVAFSYLAGNGDLHAKNLSIRQGSRGWEPTPVYDVVCTVAYGDHTLALPIGGSTNADRVSRSVLLTAAESTGVPAQAFTRQLDGLLRRTQGLSSRLVGLDLPTMPAAKLGRILSTRRERLQR